MIKKNLVLICIFELFCLFPASSEAITREDAVTYALENSEAIQMIMKDSEVMRAEGEQVQAFTKTQISLNAGYIELGDNRPENPFISYPGRNISAEARISQLIFAGGRIWKSRDLGKNFNEQADILEMTGKRDIRKQVWMAFDGVLYQQAALNILKDRLKQKQAELEDARDMKEAGAATSLDVRQAKLSLNFAHDQFREGESAYLESVIDFNLAIGRSGDEELLIPEGKLRDIPDMKAMIQQLETSLSADAFLDIKSAKTQIDAALLNYDIASGERFPEISLIAGGKTEGEKRDDMDESWNIGIQASWDIFDGGRVRAKKASAYAKMRKAEKNLSRTKKSIAGDIEKIRVNIRTLAHRIRLQEEAVKLSRKNYEDARGHYRAGTITMTDFGEFNLSYAEARFNLLRLFFLQREQVSNAEALLETIR